MLYLMILVAVPLAVITNWRRGVIQEHSAARRLVKLGGWTRNDYDSQEYRLKNLLPHHCRHQVTAYGSTHFAEYGTIPDPGPVTDEVLKLLIQLPNLREVRLSGEKQADVSLAPLRHLAQLQELRLRCGVNDDDVLAFLTQRKLEELTLNDQPITDKGLRMVANNPGLLCLHLNNTQITSDGLCHLAGLQVLHHLELANTAIDDRAIPHLAKLPGLRTLRIEGTQMTKAGCAQIKQLLPACWIHGLKQN